MQLYMRTHTYSLFLTLDSDLYLIFFNLESNNNFLSSELFTGKLQLCYNPAICQNQFTLQIEPQVSMFICIPVVFVPSQYTVRFCSLVSHFNPQNFTYNEYHLMPCITSKYCWWTKRVKYVPYLFKVCSWDQKR